MNLESSCYFKLLNLRPCIAVAEHACINLKKSPEGQCRPPPLVANARDTRPGGDVRKYPADTEIQYSCIEGYFLEPGKNLARAKCDVSTGVADWLGPTMECIRESFETW